jgi:hypothetical protein
MAVSLKENNWFLIMYQTPRQGHSFLYCFPDPGLQLRAWPGLPPADVQRRRAGNQLLSWSHGWPLHLKCAPRDACHLRMQFK